MVDVIAGLAEVAKKVATATEAVNSDGGSSPVLKAVVNEFEAKSRKAGRVGDAAQSRDAVIELEQAGDSAKAAAEGDPGIAAGTRESVLDAHLAICLLKQASDLDRTVQET